MASISRHVKHVSRYSCCHTNQLIRLLSAPATTVSRTGIRIPNRIERGPTDILKALAATVQNDSSNPHYKYIDDPYLIPTSPRDKRDFDLARASGKKAARWIIGTYARHFEHDQAHPTIQAFSPEQYSQPRVKEACEEGIRERINARLPEEAYTMYTELADAGRVSELSESVMEDLLTLLAWHGGTTLGHSEDFLPEEAFYRDELNADRQKENKCTWRQNNPAERVFNDLPKRTAASYSSLIMGMARNFEGEKPFALLAEMQDKEYEVPVGVWNALITVAHLRFDTWKERIDAVLGLMRDMSAAGVRPNLQTFNNALSIIRRQSRYRNSATVISSLLQEMKKCHIEPSLATWTSVILYFYSQDGSESRMLYHIMDRLENEKLTIRDPSDVEFFSTAMQRCQIHVKDVELAWRIHRKLEQTGSDISLFLGDAYREMLYYNTFFRLLCSFDTLENSMQIYNQLVPHAWIPQWSSMEMLFDAIELQGGHHLLPQIWSDLVIFGYWKKDNLTGRLVQLMTKKDLPKELQEQCADAVETLLLKAEADAQRGVIYTLKLDGPLLGDMIIVLTRVNRFEAAWKLFKLINSRSGSLGGMPSGDSMVCLGEHCIQTSDFSSALSVAEFMADMEFKETASFIEKLKSDMELDEAQVEQVDLLL